jgi:hypothetical protein
MSQWWAAPMLRSGGLFAGGVVPIAWERVPAWRTSDLADFRTGFAYTLRRVDRLQPALLVVCAGSTIGFASSTGGAARTLALLAAGGLLVVLVGSVAWLVPIQRRLVTAGYATQKHWQVVVPLSGVAGGVGVALLLGAVAGLYPAVRAARLAPTDALRTT